MQDTSAVGSFAGGVRPVGLPGARLCVGRVAELAGLEAALCRGGPVVVQATRGLSGIGKSTLAARYVELHGGDYCQVVWVTADSPANLAAGLTRFTLALEPESAGVLARGALVERAIGWLVAHDRWLVVLDDVADPADIRPLIMRANKGRYLVTSRRVSGWQGIARRLRLGVLDPDDACAVFVETLGVGAGAEQLLDGVEALCARLGYLPLALRVAAAYLSQQRVSATEYLRLLDAYPAKTLRGSAKGVPADRLVAQVWAVTLRALADEPLCARILRVLAWLAPSDIDPALLLFTDLGPEPAVLRAFGRLGAYGMIEDGHMGHIGIAMHPLVQMAARTADESDPYRAAALVEQGRKDAAHALYTHLPGDPADPAHWPAWRAFTPHVLAYAAAAQPGTDTVEVRDVLDLTADYLRVQGAHTMAAGFFERAWTREERASSPEDPEILVNRINLALVYKETGRVREVLPLFEANLADCERVLGPEHPTTLISRNNLASAYRDAGRLDEALALFEATLASRERRFGPEHPITLTSRNNLALAYRDAGRFDEALEVLEATVATRERLLGPDHPETLTSSNGLASAYRAAGRIDEAMPVYKAIHASRERLLGPEHPDTLLSSNNLASALREAGYLHEALPLFEATLASRERVFGPEHRSTLASRNNLATAYRDAGRLDEALTLYKATLASRERLLGPDHPATLVTRGYLATVCGKAGDAAGAATQLEALLADHVRVLGPDHRDTHTTRRHLARWRKRSGRTETQADEQGFWVASVDPKAAHRALTGSVEQSSVRQAALLTDGASILVDRFHVATWPEVMATLAGAGPHALIREVRALELSDAATVRWPRTKVHDDASAVYCNCARAPGERAPQALGD
jgi:tetratricopeptide (TPR) repeat protein